MSPFSDIAQFLSHLGDAVANLALGLQRTTHRGYETFDYVAARRAKIALTRLHKYGTEMGVGQNVIPRRFQWYLNEPSPQRWVEVRTDVSRILEALPDIAAEAADADSAFVLEPAYKAYIETIGDRRTILSGLLQSPPPTSPDELAAFGRIREAYIRLMEELERCQSQLSDYIRRRFPGQPAELAEAELPDARPDTRSMFDPRYREG